jgi:hypothetical protein
MDDAAHTERGPSLLDPGDRESEARSRGRLAERFVGGNYPLGSA